MRTNLILTMLMVSLSISAHTEKLEYDSLENINGFNITEMKGQTLYYPSDQPVFRYLFYKKPGGDIFKEDNWMDLTSGYTKEKYVIGKHFYVDEVIKHGERDFYLKTTIVESKKKVYISCNYLLASDIPKMYVVGHLEKMKQIHLGKTYYVKDELFDSSKKWEREKNAKFIKHYKGTNYEEFVVKDVTHQTLRNTGLAIALDNGEYLLPIVLMPDYCVSKDTVDAMVKVAEKEEDIKKLLGWHHDFDLEYIKTVDIDSVVVFGLQNGNSLTIELLLRKESLELAQERINKYGYKNYKSIIYSNRNFNWSYYDDDIELYGLEDATLIATHQVKVGWTKEMVLKSLGRPDDKNSTHTIKGTFDQWIYGEGVNRKYYHFDNDILISYSD